MNEPLPFEKRVRALAPDLEITSIRVNHDGLVNDIVIINDELVFRFPKVEYGLTHLPDELNILRLLQQYISLEIPRPAYENQEGFAYHLIQGETLRRDLLFRLTAADQQAIAEQLARFLKELHGVPTAILSDLKIPMADALMKYEAWVGIYDRIREKVFPRLMPHLREWATEHFETQLADRNNFAFDLKLVDTDLVPYHILFDRQARRINGIIDFGGAGLGDPAIDLGVLIYNYGESFVRRFWTIYPEAEKFLPRARFYAGAQELRWLLTGIERDDPWWFAVHVGGAKDVEFTS